MNDCKREGAEKCWEITPAIMAGQETVLDNQSFLRALGEISTRYFIFFFVFRYLLGGEPLTELVSSLATRGRWI